jgi:vitamin B12 transporter
MARKFGWMIVLMTALKLEAQTMVSGRVLDNRKQPLRGVSIAVKDSYDGATSDSTGRFRFSTTESGKQVVTASSIGFKKWELPVEISGKELTMDIILKEEVSELNAVVITAGTFEASDRKRATVMSSLDIVTTASGNGDVTGALKTLPGAQQIGDKEGLFVRGGTAAETRTFIDGTVVNNFFYSSVPNIAQRGRFSPFIFKGTIFSTGGYSALYGQALSSALILESIDLPDQTSANLGISVIGLSGGYQYLDPKKKWSAGANYSYSNLWPAFQLFKQKQEYEKVPVFHTGDANFRIKTSKTGMLKYYGYFSTNDLAFFTPSIDTPGHLDRFAISNLNIYQNLSWKENLGRWKMNAGFSYTHNVDDIQSGLYTTSKVPANLPGFAFKDFLLKKKGDFANAKLVLERRVSGLNTIRFGGEYNLTQERSDFTYPNTSFSQTIRDNLGAAFAEADIYITNALAAKIGGRYEHSSLLDRSNLAPRASLAYKTGKESQASVAYGIFYQNPERQYLTAKPMVGYSRATHYIAQYQKISKGITFRTEVFYKQYQDLVKTIYAYGQQAAVNNKGFGDAKGFELFCRDKKTVKNLDYWISYSYLDTKRDFLNYPFAIQPDFAAKHTASLVLKKFVTKWKTGFNAAYNYASGRPYFHIGYDPATQENKFFDRGITKAYHNVSLSLNYLPNLGRTKSKMFAVYVVSVSNAFGFDQVYGYQYSYNGLRKDAITPPTKFFIFVGAFLSFGVDRTDDAINNNL